MALALFTPSLTTVGQAQERALGPGRVWTQRSCLLSRRQVNSSDVGVPSCVLVTIPLNTHSLAALQQWGLPGTLSRALTLPWA